MEEFIKYTVEILISDFPEAEQKTVELGSYGIYANYVLAESYLPLKLVDQVHKLKLSSKLLCSTLG